MVETYITIKIPTGLIKKVDELLETDLGFSSRTEVIKTAIREYYDRQVNNHQVGNWARFEVQDGVLVQACWNCSAKVAAGKKFCPDCGKVIEQAKTK